MTRGDVGLPYEQREVIAGLLRDALDELGERTTAERAGDVTVRLLAAVDEFGRSRALFELAAAAMVVIGGPPGIPGTSALGPFTYVGHGAAGREIRPETALDYQISAFGTAILAHDRPQAWELFAPLAPADGAPVRQACADFLARLVRNAWSRHYGGGIQIAVPPGDRWPPTCDFCCHDDAAWMWHCVGGDIQVRTGHSAATTTLRFDDMEFWYGCDGCRPLVASAHPNWGRVFARQQAHRPEAHRPSVTAIYQAFQIARKSVEAVPLPAVRPTPTPGRL